MRPLSRVSHDPLQSSTVDEDDSRTKGKGRVT